MPANRTHGARLQVTHQQTIFQLHLGRHRQVQHMTVTGRDCHGLALAVFHPHLGQLALSSGAGLVLPTIGMTQRNQPSRQRIG